MAGAERAVPPFLLLRNLFFLVLVPGTVGVWLPLRVVAGVTAADARWGLPGAVAAALVGLGAAGLTWCVWDFGARGRGTPAPFDPPRQLVVHGLYRRVRNPMYLSLVTFLLGWALLFRSSAIALYAAVVWLFFHLFVVLYEEPTLRGTFGAEYAAYCRAVRRWLPGNAVAG